MRNKYHLGSTFATVKKEKQNIKDIPTRVNTKPKVWTEGKEKKEYNTKEKEKEKVMGGEETYFISYNEQKLTFSFHFRFTYTTSFHAIFKNK